MLRKVGLKRVGRKILRHPLAGLLMIPYGIHLVRRAKLANPLFWHYGLIVNTTGFPVAYDLRQDEGPRQITVDQLAEGHPLYIMKSVTTWPEVQASLRRLQHAVTYMSVWRLFDNNCEHFAEFVMTGKKQSGQVNLLKIAAGLFLGLRFLG